MSITSVYTIEILDKIAKDFNSQSLDLADWTHETHLAVGCWHLHHYPFDDALCRMKAGIILLNQVHGVPNTAERGYHETLTFFWMTVLHLWTKAHSSLSLAERYTSLITSPLSDKALPKHFYSDDELKSSSSRAIAMMPTKRDLSWGNFIEIPET